jgi:Ca2+/Na+ antiporter
MENIDNFLIMILLMMVFYYCLIVYLKYLYKKQNSKFTPLDSGIPAVQNQEPPIVIKSEPNVYLTEDTRMKDPLLPPVNPMARKRIIKNVIPASPGLYSDQTYDTTDYILDVPPLQNTNQLIYSGGETQLIQVPLQYNEPYEEPLRTQDILITPYNKVKYGTC